MKRFITRCAYTIACLDIMPGVNTALAHDFREWLDMPYIDRARAVEAACRIDGVIYFLVRDYDNAAMMASGARQYRKVRDKIVNPDRSTMN